MEDASYNGGPDYLSLLESLSFPVTLKFHIWPVKEQLTSKTIGRLIADRKSEIRYSRSMGDAQKERIKRQITDLESMSKRISSGRSKLVETSSSYGVSSDHPVKLRECSRIFVSLMSLLGIRVKNVKHPTVSVLSKIMSPLRNVGAPYLMDTQSAASLLPIYFTPRPSFSGVAIGVDDITEKPVFVDPFGKSSHNALIFGETGSGKSFFSKILLMRMLAANECQEMYILDPLDEYNCSLFGGECTVITREDFPSDYSLGNSNIRIFKAGSQVDEGNANFVKNTLSLIYERITKNPDQRKIILIDEAHLALGNRTTLEVVSRLVRHSRHYKTSVICVTQNVDDLSRSQLSSVVSENSSSVFLFRLRSLSNSDRNRFGLNRFSEVQAEDLMGGKHSPYSECYLLEDNTLRKVRVLSTELENELVLEEKTG